MFHISTFSSRMPRFARGALPAAAILLAVTSAVQAADPRVVSVLANQNMGGFARSGFDDVIPQVGSKTAVNNAGPTLATQSFTQTNDTSTSTDTVTFDYSTVGTSPIDNAFVFNWLVTMTDHAAVGAGALPGSMAEASTAFNFLIVNFQIDTPMVIHLNTLDTGYSSYPTIVEDDVNPAGTYQVVFNGSSIGTGQWSDGSYDVTAPLNFSIMLNIPEPASLGLLGVGAAALVLRRQRRKA